MRNPDQASPRTTRAVTPLAVLSCLSGMALLALLVSLNMGGCGVSDVASGVGSGVSNMLGGNHSPPSDTSGGAGAGVTNTLNTVHTGTAVDQIGVGNAFSAGKQAADAVFISDQQEANIGRNVALQVTGRFGVVNDPRLERYVTLVGLTVADASPRTDFPYCFAVLNSNQVNAYSGPDGPVMITRGALLLMQDESELAGALGHEIGHINKHHGLAAVRRAGLLGAVLTASKNYVGQFNQISDAAGNAVLNVGFNQQEEYDADAEGVRYAAAAGYNPEGYLHFLQRMAAVRGGQTAPFSTHPGLADRAARVAAQITREGLGGKGQTLQQRFDAHVLHPAAANQ